MMIGGQSEVIDPIFLMVICRSVIDLKVIDSTSVVIYLLANGPSVVGPPKVDPLQMICPRGVDLREVCP